MSNLGGYQVMTTMAKHLGGPSGFAATLIGGGILIGVCLTKGIEEFIKTANDGPELKDNQYGINRFFTAQQTATDQTGFTLMSGDVFRVLESDSNAILIEVKGKSDNPYCVSGTWLEKISDFRKI